MAVLLHGSGPAREGEDQLQILTPLLMVAPLSHTHVLSGRHPVRGATVVPCQPPAEDGLAAIVAIRRDRGGQRGFLPRQGEGPHFAHMRQVICFTWQGIGLHAPGLAPKIWVGSKLWHMPRRSLQTMSTATKRR